MILHEFGRQGFEQSYFALVRIKVMSNFFKRNLIQCRVSSIWVMPIKNRESSVK